MGRKRRLAVIEERIRRRMELVFQVCAGQITAREAARQLGVTPKTYYAWERRILEAASRAVANRPAGRRTPTPDPEQERLRTENEELRRRLVGLQSDLKVQELFSEFSQTLRETGVISSPEKKKGR